MKKPACWCVFVLLLAVGGCDTAAEEPPSLLPFQTIEDAAAFNVLEAGTAVIRDEATWRRLWELHWGVFDGTGARTPPPAVNFERHMLIAVFWGEGYSGCSNGVQAVKSVIWRPDAIVVRVGPLPDLGPCDALVYPIQVIRVERFDLRVFFEGEVPR
ncbi:MAG: hypothetical protein ACE5G0_15670 [Rhodothermales bacterium]